MKTLVFISMLLVQASASIFSEFTGALTSVESSVGKLLSDVGHDLKETYDCTIDAVEEVLYDKDQIPKYYEKCKPTTSTESNNVASDNVAQKAISLYIQPVIPVISKQSEDTNKSINIVTDSKDMDKKLASVEEVVNNEYYRVDNMSSHLEHEFDGLAKNVDIELKKIDEDKVDLHTTLLEIEKLHLQEETDIEKTKEEIRQAFDEMLKKINNSSNESHPKNEIEDTVKRNFGENVMQKTGKWESGEKEMEQLKYFKNDTKNETQNITKSNIPRTFKDVAAQVSKQTSTINPNNEYILSSTKPQASNTIRTLSSSETVTQALTTTTIGSSTGPMTRVSTISTFASTEPVIDVLNSAITVSSTESEKVATTTVSSTKSISQSSNPITIASTTEPATEVSTATITTKGTTEAVIRVLTTTSTESTKEIITDVMKTSTMQSPRAPMTTTTMFPTEPIISTTTTTTTLKPKKHTKKPKIRNKYKHTAAKHYKTKRTTTPKPPDDYDGLVTKDPKTAAAEALKVFSKSMKTKSVLDNFLKHLRVTSRVF